MRLISQQELHSNAVKDLGFDPSAVDLTAPEAIAALIRVAAAWRTPCTSKSISDAVLSSLRGAVSQDSIYPAVEDMLEALVGYGDLIELPELDPTSQKERRLLYSAPPSFIVRQSGRIVLVGMIDQVRDSLGNLKIEIINHVRRIDAGPLVAEVRKKLLDTGLIELPERAWLFAPGSTSPKFFRERMDQRLAEASPCGVIEGLSIMGSTSEERYRKRWRQPKNEAGRFVGRRPQLFGADLWCYIELANGTPTRFVDLPTHSSSNLRACDEAWHLQMALDSLSGRPQRYRTRTGPPGQTILDFFSPVPSWIQRRLDAIGRPTPPSGCLISYCLPNAETEQETAFLEKNLWLESVSGSI